MYVYIHMYVCKYVYMYNVYTYKQPIAFGVSFNHILQSESNRSLFNGTWQKRPSELDNQ